MVAQRRMGKTSLLREFQRRSDGERTCVYVDLQKAKDAPEAIVEISLALKRQSGLSDGVLSVFGNTIEKLGTMVEKISIGDLGVTLRAGLNAGNWSKKGSELLEVVAGSEQHAVLMLDEVPILANRLLKGSDYTITPERREALDEFMSWLRECASRHRGQLSIILTGSIGFEPILRQAGLSATLNSFAPFELLPWDDETATGCLIALARQRELDFEEGATEELLSRLGCNIPHHVQTYFDRLHETCHRRGDDTITRDDVARVYEERMLSTRGHAELTHYEDRLKMLLGHEALPMALDLLTEAATVGHVSDEALRSLREDHERDGFQASLALDEIRRVLEHDGYLRMTDRGLVFVSKLLRDWWKARHGFAYVEVARR
ncbi:MAG: ATP-binding protein [Acidobacteriota bacterium]